MEKRSINFELRAKPESRTIFGTATVFNSSYDMGWYDEEMSSESLNEADMKDVVALFNHDMNMVLARTSSGTLKLNVTGNAMEYEFEAPNTTLGNDLLEMVKRGETFLDEDVASNRFVVVVLLLILIYGGYLWMN